jgi:hypothetical protein
MAISPLAIRAFFTAAGIWGKKSEESEDNLAKKRRISAKGPMAEWLRRGLQILARRFDSGSGLHSHSPISVFALNAP